MYYRFSFLKLAVRLLLFGLLNYCSIFAQVSNSDISGGKDYWIGIPHLSKSPGENLRWQPNPIQICISSKVDTKAKIEDANGTIGSMTVNLYANQVKVIFLPDIYMNTQSEVVTNNGIHVSSDDIISVQVLIAYGWTGEAYNAIPSEWLGKKYYALNFYEDYCLVMNQLQYFSPQILIVATNNNTKVTYYPTIETVEGVKKGQYNTVTLNKGQTYLIEAKINSKIVQLNSSSLTGTYIKSTQPIAVISGHTKGSVPILPFNYFKGNVSSDFLKNSYFDQMLPIELLGTKYISVPVQFGTPSPRVIDATNTGMDLKGDLVRFVATQDNTVIYQMRSDGSALKQISLNNMKAGDFFDVEAGSLMYPSYFQSNKPVLSCQLSKAWIRFNVWNNFTYPGAHGLGMMFSLTPVEQWSTNATFTVPTGISNYINITFYTKDIKNLNFDNVSFQTSFGSICKQINGTDYSYVSYYIASGDHHIDGINGAKFTAYVYGNQDAVDMVDDKGEWYGNAFAYGYPVGINYTQPCDDSLYFTDTIHCGNVSGSALAIDLQTDTSCAAIYSINEKPADNINYQFDDGNFVSGSKQANFTFSVIDVSKSSQGTVEVMSHSGKVIEKTYSYTPESFSVDSTFLNYGKLQHDKPDCMNFTITNSGTVPITVKNLRQMNNVPEFTITNLKNLVPFTLQPNEKKIIEVCCTITNSSPHFVWDSIIADLSCYSKPIVRLEARSGDPILWFSDKTWKDIPINIKTPGQFRVENRGTLDAVVYTITWKDSHFTEPSITNDLPLTLKPGESRTYNVNYTPDTYSLTHTDIDTAFFTANCDAEKLFSLWIGNGTDAAPTISSYDWGKVRVVDDYADLNPDPKSCHPGLKNYNGTITINNIPTSTDQTDLLVVSCKIDPDTDPDSVFTVNQLDVPTYLHPNQPVTLHVTFTPKAEKDYSANVILTVITASNDTISITGTLTGRGCLPHLNVTGYIFPKIKIGTQAPSPGNCFVNYIIQNPSTTWDLNICSLTIQDDKNNAFMIDPNLQLNFPIKIPIGDSITIPVLFTAKSKSDTAWLVAMSDAPKEDNHRGQLIGFGYTEGLETTNNDYLTFLFCDTKEGKVTVTNTGSEDIVLNQFYIFGADASSFQIKDWTNSMTGSQDTLPMTLQAGATLTIDVIFKPTDKKSYKAQVEYDFANGNKVFSSLNGVGSEIWFEAFIPDYSQTAYPPATKHSIDVKVKQYPGETQNFTDADVHDLRFYIDFSNAINGQDFAIKPVVDATGNLLNARLGSIVSGWKINTAVYELNNKRVYVDISGDQPISINDANGVNLFSFDIYTYLNKMTTIALPLRMDIPLKVCVNVKTDSGLIALSPVCVNNLRMIQLSNFASGLKQNNPNPVTDKTTIEFSVGLDALTNITLYNIYGQKAAELVNQQLQPGQYTIEISPAELGLSSGAYYYIFECGPEKDIKQMIITR